MGCWPCLGSSKKPYQSAEPTSKRLPEMAAMEAPKASAAALDRVGGALWGLFIGDALAMPSHWYYGGAQQVARDYGGPIKGYVKPKKELMGSIMNKSNTGGGGRGSDSGEIIGKVINHGKKDFWTARGSYHYHCTLQAGENTLEAQLTRLVCKSIIENGGNFDPANLRERYVQFMTTPGSHNDCYASTCHRMFFANLVRGTPPEKCPDNDNHNVDTIDGLIMAVPVMLAGWNQPLRQVQQEAGRCTAVTRNSNALLDYAANLTDLLCTVVAGKPLVEALSTTAGPEAVRGAARRPDPVVA